MKSGTWSSDLVSSSPVSLPRRYYTPFELCARRFVPGSWRYQSTSDLRPYYQGCCLSSLINSVLRSTTLRSDFQPAKNVKNHFSFKLLKHNRMTKYRNLQLLCKCTRQETGRPGLINSRWAQMSPRSAAIEPTLGPTERNLLPQRFNQPPLNSSDLADS